MLKKIICAFVISSLFICSCTFASTKEELISAINKTYEVGDESYRLPQKIVTKAENYLNKNPLTEDQYDRILRCIDKAVALAKEKGTTDISKYSKEEVIEILNILVEASSTANLDLEKELSEIGMGMPINSGQNNDNAIEEKKEEIKENSGQAKDENKKIEKNEENKKEDNKTEVKEEINNELKEEIKDSGETETNESNNTYSESEIGIISGEILGNINVSELVSSDKNVDIIIERNIKILMAILIGILFINILLFCLILRAKWNRIWKWILIIIFVILIITVLVVLVLFSNYTEEIKLIYKLYYIFK